MRDVLSARSWGLVETERVLEQISAGICEKASLESKRLSATLADLRRHLLLAIEGAWIGAVLGAFILASLAFRMPRQDQLSDSTRPKP